MSSALVRQALEFVDQEETGGKRKDRRAAAIRRNTAGQERHQPYKSKPKSHKSKADLDQKSISSDQRVEENIKKLLALSTQTADRAVAEKIVKRAVKGKPLLEKIEVKKEEYKSILFPDEEPYSKFEKEPFCS